MGRGSKRSAPAAPATAAKNAKTAATVPQLVADPSSAASGPNMQIMANLADCDTKIKDHYGDLTSKPTANSGIPAYDKKVAQATLGLGQPYVASVPLFWLNLQYEAQPGVPKHARRINALEAHFFDKPNHMPDTMVVVLNSGELPHNLIGALRSVDPPEPREALRQAVARAIDAKQPRRVLDEWREILMSCAVRFEVSDHENQVDLIFKHLVQKREDIVKKKETMFVTTLMRIYEIAALKSKLSTTDGRQNKDALAKRYEAVKFADSTEPVKAKYIEAALTVYNNILNVPAVKDILFQLDNLDKNPLDSVYKLREIGAACDKKPATMEWCFSMMLDYWQQNPDLEAIPIASLKDSAACSLPRLLLWKRSLRDFLWRKMDAEFPLWETAVRSEIRRITDSVAAFRASAHLQSGHAAWPASAEQLLIVFETLVFGYAHDETVASQLKNRRTIEDILELKELKGLVDRPASAYATETGQDAEPALEDDQETAQATAARLVTEAADSANLSIAETLLRAIPEDERKGEDAGKLNIGIRIAERRVGSFINLVVDSDDADVLSSALKGTLAATTRGDVESRRYVAVIVDAKLLCESGSQAKYRLPPTRPHQVKRLIDAFLSTRADGDLDDADVLVGIDGGKGGDWDEKTFRKLLPAKKYGSTKHLVIYTFDSVASRQERASKNPVQLTETVSFTHGPPELNLKAPASLALFMSWLSL